MAKILDKCERFFQDFLVEIRKIPYPAGLRLIHALVAEARNKYFFDPAQPWLNPAQLAAFAKYITLDGYENDSDRLALVSLFELSKPYKDFWVEAEQLSPYSEDDASLAVFLLRMVYQQLPFLIYPERVPGISSQTAVLYSILFERSQSSSRSAVDQFQTQHKISIGALLKTAEKLYWLFLAEPRWNERLLQLRLDVLDQRPAEVLLNLFSCDRAQFRDRHQRTQAAAVYEKPYELNPLLRYPILKCGSDYWAPYPELIVYAVTRGLYFYFAEILGESFKKDFGDCFQKYAEWRAISYFGEDAVYTEDRERELGFSAKTNDFTVFLRDKALLCECKTSGLFFSAKRHASLEEIRADLGKTLANSKSRSGVFQLYDKMQAISSGQLPRTLNERYATVRQFYPVMLLYDQILFANASATLGSLIQSELNRSGIHNFQFQVWTIDEFENAMELSSISDFADLISDKFSDEYRELDLNSYLFKRTGKQFLQPCLFIPKGDTKASQILQLLMSRQQPK